jgi:hypothetical protein
MKEVTCDQCGESRQSFIGPESKPLANFCEAHGRALTKANAKRRGRIIESIVRKRLLLSSRQVNRSLAKRKKSR